MQVITITRTIKANFAAERARLTRKLEGEQRNRVLALVDAFATNDMAEATNRFVQTKDNDLEYLDGHLREAIQEAVLQHARQNLPAGAKQSQRAMRSFSTVSVH